MDYLPYKGVFLFEALALWGKTGFKYQEMIEEIEGLCEAAGLQFGKVLFLNFMYELTTFKSCSGFLVRNSTGDILHGRNMDFPFF